MAASTDNNEKWSELGIKSKLAIVTALVAFFAGWTLVGLAAFVPVLISESGVLAVLGEGLIYASGVFGVTAYFSAEAVRLRRDLTEMMHRKFSSTEE